MSRGCLQDINNMREWPQFYGKVIVCYVSYVLRVDRINEVVNGTKVEKLENILQSRVLGIKIRRRLLSECSSPLMVSYQLIVMLTAVIESIVVQIAIIKRVVLPGIM